MIFPWDKKAHEELDKIKCLLSKLAKAHKELRMYKQVWEHSADAMFLLLAPDGVILDANPAAVELYGYSVDELLKLKITDISADPEGTTSTFTRRAIHIPFRHHKTKSGFVFPISATISFFKDKNGEEHEYAAVICRPITPTMKHEICDDE